MNAFAYIKSQVAIIDVIGAYTTLKKAGHYWKGICPLHHEKTPSFTVSPEKNIFYCFGCHATGDVISFMAKMENCTQIEATQILAKRYNLDLPNTHETTQSTQLKKHYFQLCEVVAQWCHQQLKKTAIAQQYMSARAITQNAITYYNIGFFPGGLVSIKKFLQDMNAQNILLADLTEAGLILQGKNVLYSPFEERIMFPIKDNMGNYCGFGGRIFKENDTRAKYYNSKENEFFTKGSLLFGLDLAKKSIQKNECVFIVEGYTDCIAMAQAGFTNTVATLGTACTSDHLKQIARYATNVYVVYDGDSAGQQAILRLAHLCWQVSLELKIVSLPTGLDPASYLSKGNSLQPLVDQSQDILLFYINRMGSDFSHKPLSEKITLSREIITLISKLDDQLKQDILLLKTAQTLQIPFEALKGELERASGKITTQQTNSEKSPKKIGSGQDSKLAITLEQIPHLEKNIFFGIMNNISLLNLDNQNYLITYLPEPFNDILSRLRDQKESNSALEFSTFFETLNHDEQQWISQVLLTYERMTLSSKQFDQLVEQLQKKHWKAIVQDIMVRLEHARHAGDSMKANELLQEFVTLKKKLIHRDTL